MGWIEVDIDCDLITDRESFHDLFAQRFGFFSGYGRNMNAWIDCMDGLDDPEGGLSTFTIAKGDAVVLKLLNAESFAVRCPDLRSALVDCASFVNWRRSKQGCPPLIALAYES
jgi:hypothetical protein